MPANTVTVQPPSRQDRDTLRDLARRVAEAAVTSEQQQHRAQALEINRLTARRPSVLPIPEGAWPEVLGDRDLQCADERCRGWEQSLRRRLLHHDPAASAAELAGRLGRNVVFSRKPNPAHVCAGFQEDEVRREFRETLTAAGDCVVEFILKDTHTVENRPDRFPRFVAIAREEIARFYGD